MEDYKATTRNGHQFVDNYDKRDKGIECKKRVFVDMDNVLVDFESGQIGRASCRERV
mgnify:CR=1 FL=1